MKKDDFLQAKLFMFSDIEREIQLAKADENALVSSGVKPGGGNFLAALGLLCYTEFGGKLKFGNKKSNGTDHATKNFNDFFDEIGDAYKQFRSKHNVYDIFRCGLAHEYYVKKNCTIAMIACGSEAGISTNRSGHFYFVVESYYRDLKAAFDNLQITLFGK